MLWEKMFSSSNIFGLFVNNCYTKYTKSYKLENKRPSVNPLIHFQYLLHPALKVAAVLLESVPAVKGWRQADTLDKTNKCPPIDTQCQFIFFQFTSHTCFGLWKEAGEPGIEATQTRGEHSNPTHKVLRLGIEPATFLLCSNSAKPLHRCPVPSVLLTKTTRKNKAFFLSIEWAQN